MTLDRRSLLLSGMAGAVATALPTSLALAAKQPGNPDEGFARLLRRHAHAFLHRSPEEATGMGYDTGANSSLRGRLDDRSQAAREADKAAIAIALAELDEIDVLALSRPAQIDHAVASFVYQTLADTLGRYGYVDANLRPSPYIVSQMNGAYYWLPDFIGSTHPIENDSDISAWYDRLAALAIALDQETDRIRIDVAAGVIPPGFVIDRTVRQIEALRDAPPRTSSLMARAIARAAAAGLGDIATRGEAIFRQQIAPALDRQANALKALRAQSVETAGCWRLPDGDAYYASALRANTTSTVTPEELHRQGLDQCAALIAEIDAGLKAQGLTKGSVGDRIKALNADPRFTVSDDDAGRAQLLKAAEASLDSVRERLSGAFSAVEIDPLVVRRIPVAIENGAPGAFYSEGTAGQPGTYSLNLKNPGEHPLWRLPTLTHHEGIPGHHYQASVLRHGSALPLFRKIVRFSAYTEGWALYAQQVADELGVFEGDPFGRIGYLQSELFRAARIVVDTGLHHKRWSREEAVQWMVDNAGESPESTDREVVRYAVYPGQACSFKVGANRIVAAREAARARLGAKFDIHGYHDLVLRSGPVPMAVLEEAASQWMT
ncbi:uncharacterized protein (DUF885 family) [Blastomonas natatoria]|uniref:Uncharacterized protein (DUF885 family) n=1 Tax=Blastomonas natatoria TaxID=34015 RepID=A0A2V3UYF2_9SPHN|nr:DUF885 family protein [Blastomonas natatoria]PXW74446.1 uncharacterized protein (DUF885 family) [Blastomonas natatoria]